MELSCISICNYAKGSVVYVSITKSDYIIMKSFSRQQQ